MLVRRFEWKDSPDFGYGWCPAWMDNGDPVTGSVAAHDTLEHFPRCIGGFEGEMMAFGAMHYIRGDASGYDWKKSDIYRAQRSDIAFFLRNILAQDQTCRDPGRVPEVDRDIDTDKLKSSVRQAIVDSLKEESENQGKSLTSLRRTLPANLDTRIVGWILKGYDKARKRFSQWDIPEWELEYLFCRVRDEFDRLAGREGNLGEQIVVRVNFARPDVQVSREYRTQWNQW